MTRRKPLQELARPGLFVALLACSACALAPPRPAAPDEATERADWSFAQGERAAARGDTVRAEQYFSLALERGYDARKVLPVLLSVCLKSSRLRAALDHAEPYLQNHPDDHELRYLVASIYAGLGATEKAQAELERLLRNDPAHADGHFLLAVLELEDDPDRAREHFRSYLDLAPTGDHAADVRERLRELALRNDAARTKTPTHTGKLRGEPSEGHPR